MTSKKQSRTSWYQESEWCSRTWNIGALPCPVPAECSLWNYFLSQARTLVNYAHYLLKRAEMKDVNSPFPLKKQGAGYIIHLNHFKCSCQERRLPDRIKRISWTYYNSEMVYTICLMMPNDSTETQSRRNWTQMSSLSSCWMKINLIFSKP